MSEIVPSLPGEWQRELMRQIDSTVCRGSALPLKFVITSLKKDLSPWLFFSPAALSCLTAAESAEKWFICQINECQGGKE